MRIPFTLMLLILSVSLKAQTALPGCYINQLQQPSFTGYNRINDSIPDKKWSVTKYACMSAGVGFFNGGNATIFAVPVGIQVNRKLNNNWYAFAGVSAAPAYVNFNRSFLSANTSKSFQNNSFLQSNSFNMYSRAELGLMYVNDQKTFSISGSIGVERCSNPFIPFNQSGTARRNTFIVPNK